MMIKANFIKEFQFARRMQRIITRINGETDEEYNHRVKIAKYGLEGEDRANYELANIFLPIICLSDVRLELPYGSAQADFIVISKDKLFLIEVKNLYGSIKVLPNGDCIRLIPRRRFVEEEGMPNPFNQIRRQAFIFQKFLEDNGYIISIDTLVVMGNPKTTIIQENCHYPLIRYDQLNNYFSNLISVDCNQLEYQKMLEIGNLLKENHKDRFYNDFDIMHKHFEKHNRPLPNFTGDDLKLYEELLECRRKISKLKKIPACNIFINHDAENLVIYKPTTKEEFLQVPGFKEKKYLLCGKEVIEIIKKYR